MIKLTATATDALLIKQIVDRMVAYMEQSEIEVDRTQLAMDVTACHLNGSPLRLTDLLAAPRFDFTHDVLGVSKHMDRKTGKLKDCFLPRFAVREGK